MNSVNIVPLRLELVFVIILLQNSKEMSVSINEAINCYKRTRDEFSLTTCESQLKLIRYQSSLEEKLKHNFHNLTLHDTLVKLLDINELKLADKLRSEFKVPERR